MKRLSQNIFSIVKTWAHESTPATFARLALIIAIGASAIAMTACGTSTVNEVQQASTATTANLSDLPSGETALPTGAWGGQAVNMSVTSSGATISLPCQSATIPTEIGYDSNGSFSVNGTVSSLVMSVNSTAQAANFSGQLSNNGTVLHLTVTNTGSNSMETNEYDLTLGQTSTFAQCQ